MTLEKLRIPHFRPLLLLPSLLALGVGCAIGPPDEKGEGSRLRDDMLRNQACEARDLRADTSSPADPIRSRCTGPRTWVPASGATGDTAAT